ncbi:MAG TPA: hypothetical protein VIN40_10530 [Candidatus Tyrphobacter sp.]
MRAREIPGALALGLLASLLAHAAGYGGGHAMGGAYHEAFAALAAVGGLASALASVALAWAGAGSLLDGSILAARLRRTVPGWPATLAAAACWFTLAERLEPKHQATSRLFLIVALALAAWLLLALARAALSMLARIAIAVRKTRFALRATARVTLHRTAARTRTLLRCVRRYARPPPAAVIGA